MNTLTYEKLSKFDRVATSAFGVPFAAGELVDPRRLRLLGPGGEIPVQTTVTGRWPDGTVRWLWCRCLAELPGNAAASFRFEDGGETPPPEPASVATWRREQDGSVRVSTGRLSATVPSRGVWPVTEVEVDGRRVGPASMFSGFRFEAGAEEYDSSLQRVRVVVEEAGPLCVVVRVEADAEAEAEAEGPSGAMVASARLLFWAGQPEVTCQYTLTNRRRALGESVDVRNWRLPIDMGEGPAVLRGCLSTYLDQVRRSEQRIDLEIDETQWLGSGNEHQVQAFAGNCWVDWTGPDAGLMVCVRHAWQNFPKAFRLTPRTIDVELYPSNAEEPLAWFNGTAKTHELLLHFHPPDEAEASLSDRALRFHLPDQPRLEPGRFGRSGVWVEPVFAGPQSARLMSQLLEIADIRPVGLGVFNFGDEHDVGYTSQGRGAAGRDEGDRLIWLNNEYDLTHHLAVLYALTGERRVLEYAINGASHWADVDVIHSPVDPSLRGGHVTHCRRHVAEPKVGPSHQWVQGLFDAYHLSGDPRFRDAAVGIADNVAHHVESRGELTPGREETREMGWAMRALLNAWRETQTPRYLELARRIVGLFRQWAEGSADGGMLAPYQANADVRINFMNALTGVSLAHWAEVTGDRPARRIVTDIADDMLEHGLTPYGLPYYKQYPSVARVSPNALGPPLELLAWAFRFSDDQRYLRAGLPILQRMMTTEDYHLGSAVKRPMTNGIYGVVELEPKAGKVLAMNQPACLQFVAAANSRRLVESLDTPLRL